LPTADHPFSGIMNAARKVVFSRQLQRGECRGVLCAFACPIVGMTQRDPPDLIVGGPVIIVEYGKRSRHGDPEYQYSPSKTNVRHRRGGFSLCSAGFSLRSVIARPLTLLAWI
jgi:hypothetical protein